ncbi:agouti-signaling protein 2b [Haplochromis burtoni]|uniref:Agouti signaling protein, nonagouti homolog (mouse) 2b n=1 Tax=Haplochromis burtoni TaxID=8153 RepID=A0A3Q3C886_HAPBU|nr:agouti-signaling protein 2b [Haplochromis burtoni]
MHRAHHVASACFSPRSQPTSSFTAREKPEGTNQPRHLIIIMRKITGKHLLCFFLLALPMSWAEDTKKDVRKRENVTVWSQAKNRRLFARQKISPPRQSVTPKHKSNLVTPARRCGRLMESCSPHLLCCDPCASCRCRLFNTICLCWRMNPLCLKRT